MQRVLRNFMYSIAIALGVMAVAAMPTAIFAGGICEDMCGECYSNPEIKCAALDGCSKSANECYFTSGPCEKCDGEIQVQ
jgi:hypothetical protein